MKREYLLRNVQKAPQLDATSTPTLPQQKAGTPIVVLAVLAAVAFVAWEWHQWSHSRQTESNAVNALPGGPPAQWPAPGPGFGGMGHRELTGEWLQKSLHSDDEEWSRLKPLLEQLQRAREQARAGRLPGPPGWVGGPPNRPPAEEAPSLLQEKMDALHASLDSVDPDPSAIAGQIQALHQARSAAAEEVRRASDALRQTLSPLQEGELIWLGILD